MVKYTLTSEEYMGLNAICVQQNAPDTLILTHS